jgi:DNA-binding MarR family transcriptional regulator
MDKKTSRISELNFAFLHAAYAYMDYEKETHLLKTKDGEPLYPAGVHMVSEIQANPGIHVMGLADKLGVTAGAVSQILSKLEKNGLITKEKDNRNQSRFLLALTPDGEDVHQNHVRFHEVLDNVLSELLGDDAEEKISFLTNFLNALEKKIRVLT